MQGGSPPPMLNSPQTFDSILPRDLCAIEYTKENYGSSRLIRLFKLELTLASGFCLGGSSGRTSVPTSARPIISRSFSSLSAAPSLFSKADRSSSSFFGDGSLLPYSFWSCLSISPTIWNYFCQIWLVLDTARKVSNLTPEKASSKHDQIKLTLSFDSQV